MAEHTPTPWTRDRWGHPKPPHGHRDIERRETVVLDGFALSTGPHNPEAQANSEIVLACVNAFAGREIPTDKITTGLFWEMRDLLAVIPPEYFPSDEARALLAKLEGGE